MFGGSHNFLVRGGSHKFFSLWERNVIGSKFYFVKKNEYLTNACMYDRGEKNSCARLPTKDENIGFSRKIMIPQYLIEDIRQYKF